MHASEHHPLLERIEIFLGLAQEHHSRRQAEMEMMMQNLPELISAVNKLIASRQTALSRAEAAEAENGSLKAQIASDEEAAKHATDVVDAEIEAEMGAAPTAPPADTVVSGHEDTVTGAFGNGLVHEDTTVAQ
jgi:predicted RNase H-like nuclease